MLRAPKLKSVSEDGAAAGEQLPPILKKSADRTSAVWTISLGTSPQLVLLRLRAARS